MKLPKVIWLQVDPEGMKPGGEMGDEVTWCSDKINDNDIRYIIDKRHLSRT